jgi:sister chromatid cohesion protein DCC1
MKRSIEEVGSDGHPVTLSIGDLFSQNSSKYRLLKASKDVLAALKAGERVCFKGSDGSDAVLCTRNKTMKIQKVETSNTVLLVPPLDEEEAAKVVAASAAGNSGEGDENSSSSSSSSTSSSSSGSSGKPVVFKAVGASTFQFETEVMAPRLEQLDQLVGQCPYGTCHGDESGGARESLGHDPSSAAQQGRLTFAELRERVQASEGEIRDALAAMHAIEIDGRWCSVHEDALAQTFEDIRLHIDADDVRVDSVSLAACAAALPDCDPVLVRHCLRVFAASESAPEESAPEVTGEERVALDWTKVATHQAHKAFQLFQEEVGGGGGGGGGDAKAVPRGEFFSKWNSILPGAWGTGEFDEAQYEPLLGGIALKTSAKAGPTDLPNAPLDTFTYLPEREMPLDPAARFELLFGVKAKWTEAELDPYLKPLECPGVTVGSLRLKYTRMTIDGTNKDAPPIFSSRAKK